MKTDSFARKDIAPPREGQLPLKCVKRSQLVGRLSAVDRYLDDYREVREDLGVRNPDLISDKFLKCLIDVLDAPCLEDVSFAERLRSAVCEYARDAARIRFELSRVPFLFVYRREVYHTQPLYGRVFHRFVRDGLKYVYGSDSFPPHVLVESVDELSDGQVVWGFYPLDLFRYIVGVKRVRVWKEETSFVNWVFSSDLIASRVVVDGAIVLGFASCDSSDVSGLVASDGSAKERLYVYICAQSPVRIRDLVALNIVSRSQTYRLLHQLDMEDRIDRASGVCVVKAV